MRLRLGILIVLVVTFHAPVDLIAVQAEKPKAVPKQAAVSCWPGEPEIQNPHPSKHRPSRLPPALANAKVQRSIMLLRICVSETGTVARVLVLESSGNTDVDAYYTTELSKWTFTPTEREKKKVRSVVPVAVTLHIK